MSPKIVVYYIRTKQLQHFCYDFAGLQQAVEQRHQRIQSLEKTKGLLEERLGKLSSDVKSSEQQNSILQNEVCTRSNLPEWWLVEIVGISI